MRHRTLPRIRRWQACDPQDAARALLRLRGHGGSAGGLARRGRKALVEGIRRLVEGKTLVEGQTPVEGKALVEGHALPHGHRRVGPPVRLLDRRGERDIRSQARHAHVRAVRYLRPEGGREVKALRMDRSENRRAWRLGPQLGIGRADLVPPLGWECKPEDKPGNERRDPQEDQAHPDVNQEFPRPYLARSPRAGGSRHSAFPKFQPKKTEHCGKESSAGSPSHGRRKRSVGARIGVVRVNQAALEWTDYHCTPDTLHYPVGQRPSEAWAFSPRQPALPVRKSLPPPVRRPARTVAPPGVVARCAEIPMR